MNDFIFWNSGTISRDETFELVPISNIYNEGYQYKGNGQNTWNVGSPLYYLFGKNDTNYYIPSQGLRSSMPLNGLGGGAFELKGDGRMTDFTIFNNGVYGEHGNPNNWARKWDIDDQIFGFMVNNNSDNSRIFQTHPNSNLTKYAIETLTYSAEYPMSRLQGIDSQWTKEYQFKINLTAFSCFKPLDVNVSSTPAAIFYFDLINDGDNDLTIDFMFNIPDIIGFDAVTLISQKNGITIEKVGEYLYSGYMTITTTKCHIDSNGNTICDDLLTGEFIHGESLAANWDAFTYQNNIYPNDDHLLNGTSPTVYQHVGYISRNITVPKESVKSFILTFSWFFPHKTFAGYSENVYNATLGQYYSNFFGDSKDVNDYVIHNLTINSILQNIYSWQMLWVNATNNLFPEYLKDILHNQPSALRTGMYFKNDSNKVNGWVQFESYSCAQVEPPHIHGYRQLAYQLLFGSVLDRSTQEVYYYGQKSNGLINEAFPGGCFSLNTDKLGDSPGQSPRGDDMRMETNI